MDLDTLNLAKKFTEQSMSGTGSVAGAPCTIKSITKEGTTNTVTFEWQMRDGTVMTSEMQVEDGEQGPKGAQGDPGPEGYSPTAAMVRDEEQGIVTIVIQDKNGKHTAILKDGKAEGFDNTDVLKKLSANANDDLVYNGRVVKGQEFSNKDVLDKFASDASGNIYYDKKILTFDNADILRLLSVVDGKLAYNGQVVDFIFMNQNVLLQLSESLDGHLVYNNNKLMYDNDISNKDVLTKISADDDNNLYYNTVKVSGEKFSNKTILDEIGENVDGKLTYKGADVDQTFSNSEVLEELSEGTAGELLYKNAQVGHVFENQDVLEKLGEDPDTGNLVYNSKIIKADLDASTAMIDQVPTADGEGGWTWADQASAISSLKDVELIDLKKNQTLVWDDTSQKWINQNQSGGGGISGKIDLLYTGTAIEEEITLSEKISDYDILQLYGTFDTTHIFSNLYGTMNLKYDGTDILNMSTVTGNNSETMIVYHSDFTITSETKITRSNIGTDNFYISQIYGIKFGSGGGLSEIPIATNETLGGIKVGDSLQISDDGILNIKKQFLQYEYVNINSSGIATDIHILPTHTVECTFNLPSEVSIACIWANTENDSRAASITRYKSKYYFGIGADERIYAGSLGRHTYIFNDQDSYCYFDGVKMTEDKCNPVELAGSRYTIGQRGTEFPFPGQIAEWIVRDKETRKTLHKLLPMKILSFGSSEIGLYDVITGKLYKNSQWTLSGNFIDYDGEIPVLDEEAF